MTDQSDSLKIDESLKLDPVWNILVPVTGLMISTYTQHMTLGAQALGFLALVLGTFGYKWHPNLHKGYRIILPLVVFLIANTYKFTLTGALTVLILAPLWLWAGRMITPVQRGIIGLMGFMLFLGSLFVTQDTPVWHTTMAAVGIFAVTTIKLDQVKLSFWEMIDLPLAILMLCWIGHNMSAVS